jgi:hypothetical protein
MPRNELVTASDTTMRILDIVGFCDRYGTYAEGQWTFYMDEVNRDNALDASARLFTAILLTSFPEYQCNTASDDLARLVKPIETTFGPFDPHAIHAAMDVVIHG